MHSQLNQLNKKTMHRIKINMQNHVLQEDENQKCENKTAFSRFITEPSKRKQD
jgi:hypothetical protein